MTKASSFPLVITIDGPAGSGKTTLARLIAQKLGISYLDTGAMFRAVAVTLGKQAWNWSQSYLQEELNKLDFSLSGQGYSSTLLLNQKPLGPEIRTEYVGMWASYLGEIPQVRKYLKTQQQKIGNYISLVTEGRDMGTEIFPKATYKFFLDATLQERAKRRWLQLKKMGQDVDLQTLEERLHIRDTQDSNRKTAPLKPAHDAIIVNTTSMSQGETLKTILNYLNSY